MAKLSGAAAKWAGMSPEERKAHSAYLAQKRAEARARKQAEVSKETDTPFMETAATPQVDDTPISDTGELKSWGQQFKDRLKGMLSGESQPATMIKGGKEKPARSLDLVAEITPLAAKAVSGIGTLIIRDPYKPCAPSDQEALTLLLPWMRILGRMVEFTGHLTENGKDIILGFLALAFYAQRATETGIQIAQWQAYFRQHPEDAERMMREQFQQQSPGATPNVSQPAGSNGAGYASTSPAPNGYQPAAPPVLANGAPGNPAPVVGVARSPDDPIAQALRADALGRRQLGLN